MKKIVALILALSLALVSAVGITIVTKELTPKGERIAVLTDIHVLSDDFLDTKAEYDHYANVDKMEMVSLAVFNTIIDNILADDTIKAVLIAGDLTENGDRNCHLAVQNALKRIEEKIPVFVINGNHDLRQSLMPTSYKSNIPFLDEFKSLYDDFGYGEALAVHDASGSYTAELTEKLRLIAIDNNSYYTEETYSETEKKVGISDDLLEWAEKQLIQAKADGKTPIAMYHQPILPQLMSLFHQSAGDNGEKLFDMMASYGVKLAICGHNHGQKITEKNGCSEIMTASTVSYSACYRTIDIFDNKADVTTHYLEKLNGKYLTSPFTPAEDIVKMTTDYVTYADNNAQKYFKRLVPWELQKLTSKGDALRFLINNSALKAVNAKIYGEGSLSETVKKYTGVDLPKTDYVTVNDLTAFFVKLFDMGDQNIDNSAPELQILEYAIMSAFYHLQETVNADPSFGDDMKLHFDYSELFGKGRLELVNSNFLHFALQYLTDAKIMNFDLTFFDMTELTVIRDYITILDDLVIKGLPLGTMLQPFIGNTYLDLLPLIHEVGYNNLAKSVLTDEAPADNNVTLTW